MNQKLIATILLYVAVFGFSALIEKRLRTDGYRFIYHCVIALIGILLFINIQ